MTMTQMTRQTGEPPGSSLAVSTAGLTKRFGNRTVVDGVNLAIPRGSVCGFVGPNGAGKTTTIRMLLGLIRPTSGKGSILGGSLTDPASYLHKVGALIEAPAFYPQLTGRENLKTLTRLGQIPSSAVEPALERTGMTARAKDKYRSYSLGMKQRLGIAAALLADPELLILDEPTNGLDPAGIVEMRGLIRSFAGDGITVLVSSHLISEIEQVCDHVVMIRGGQLVHQGPVADLAAGQRPDIVVAPEHAADLEQLAEVLKRSGLSVAASPAGETVLVQASAVSAADLNRLAAREGIILRQLSERTHSLEDVFFQLTGADASMNPGQEMGAIK
ncbi:MAG TPA: ATP-binding cassette domain-containing protein [Streptosporangiaceae bacterium]|jgi:ABC-2 type transport system ATP-binding protein|nr:ATP-binding cassette domain-containing protein [Streptosporangiaceae bacterium]